MRHLQHIALAALLLTPSIARAADLPVRYTVEEKQLKLALSGTPLTFQLYRDAACVTPVHTAIVLIQNVTLINKLKQFTPKNDTKLPKTVELDVTLPGVTAAGNLYLKVTGTGVIPVGGVCQAQAAQVIPANCNDTIQNQNETDVDCGGSNFCPRCAQGLMCVVGTDCLTGSCVGNVCQAAPSCLDMVQNGGETDIDCGGMTPCPRCATGDSCNTGGDCQSIVCMAGVCQAPSCTDTVQNGTETDTDCGGPNACPRCPVGDSCFANSDCLSNFCSGGLCQNPAPTCTDGIQNGSETDIDCGGPNMCPRCPPGDNCSAGSDCVNMVCSMSTCQ